MGMQCGKMDEPTVLTRCGFCGNLKILQTRLGCRDGSPRGIASSAAEAVYDLFFDFFVFFLPGDAEPLQAENWHNGDVILVEPGGIAVTSSL